jgi:hypothetical protein
LLQFESVGGRASALAHAAVLRGEPDYVNESFDRYGEVRTGRLRELAAQLLSVEGRTVVDVVPVGSGVPSGLDAEVGP